MTSRVAILGSSSAYGLGVGGRSFAVRYAERLDPGAEILQLSRSALTVDDVSGRALARLREFRPDVVILSLGAAEAHVHPSRLLQALLDRFAPASWRGPAGLNPRPYYSKSRLRRLRQRAVSGSKVRLKRLIIGATGGFHRMPSDEFAARLRALLEEIGPVPKVLVGLWCVDTYMFPRSNPVLRRHDDLLRRAAAERTDTLYVPTADGVRYWDHFLADRAHLNDEGHDRVADLILDATGGAAAAARASTEHATGGAAAAAPNPGDHATVLR